MCAIPACTRPPFFLADYNQQDNPEELFTNLSKGVKKVIAGL